MNGQVRTGLTSGRVLGGRFRIVRLLGQGGMARVYLARDLRSGRQVAVKALKEEFNTDQEFVRRFDTEARAASSLNHPNIVKVLGVGEEEGTRYMIQEYIEGTSLKDMIEHYGRLDWRVAVPIGQQIALALEHAHQAGIIHRDIKPHNILVTPERQALVTDFGIARANNSNTITLAGGNAMGSVHYFSPEQAKGGVMGAGADIYSLGILFYEMLTGDVPFDGESSVAVAIKHLQEEARHPCELCPDIPRGLGDIIMKCIQKSTRQRYRSARELIDELDAFLLHPEGQYGQIPQHPEDLGSTQSHTGLVYEAGALDSLMGLDGQIRDRRRKRRRDIALIITVLLFFLAGLALILTRLFQALGDPTSRSKVFKVGNYVGKNQAEVIEMLRKDGFKQYRIQNGGAQADIPAGQIMRQDPAPGTELSIGGSQELLLTVSEGADSLKMPLLTGFAEKDAKERLLAKGYNVLVDYKHNKDVQKGLVISTNPEAGTVLQTGQTIEILISEGPEDVEIPTSILGVSTREAKAMLEKLGLVVTVQALNANPQGEELYVVACNPDFGSRVPYGSSVTLTGQTWAELHPTPTPEPSPTPAPVLTRPAVPTTQAGGEVPPSQPATNPVEDKPEPTKSGPTRAPNS